MRAKVTAMAAPAPENTWRRFGSFTLMSRRPSRGLVPRNRAAEEVGPAQRGGLNLSSRMLGSAPASSSSRAISMAPLSTSCAGRCDCSPTWAAWH